MDESSDESPKGERERKYWEVSVKIPSNIMANLVKKTDDPSQYITELLARDIIDGDGGGDLLDNVANFDGFMTHLMRVSGDDSVIREEYMCIVQILDAYRVHYRDDPTVPTTQNLFYSRLKSRDNARLKLKVLGDLIDGKTLTTSNYDLVIPQWRIWFRKAKLRANKLMKKHRLTRFGNAYGSGSSRKHPPPPDMINLYTQWYENAEIGTEMDGGGDSNLLLSARRSYRTLLDAILDADDELDNYTAPIDESSVG